MQHSFKTKFGNIYMAKQILGLDLGTNSIGWAIVEQHGSSFELQHKGVKIFPLGVNKEKGIESSKASERTQKRSSRRLKARKRYRKYFTLKALIEHNPPLCPLTPNGLKEWKESGYKKYPLENDFIEWQRTNADLHEHPYAYRDLFSREMQDWQNNPELAYKLGRALYHMAQRRGFASNRKDVSDDDTLENAKSQFAEILNDTALLEDVNELKEKIRELAAIFNEGDDKSVKSITRKIAKVATSNETNVQNILDGINEILNDRKNMGAVKKGITELSDSIKAANCETLGQYFNKLMHDDRTIYENKIRGRYTERESHYEAEFNIIADKQQIPVNLRNKLHRAIFFQRPLKSQKGLVGKCPFEPSKSRCPNTHPLFEEYRMLSFLNNIKVKTANDLKPRSLDSNEIASIKYLFFRVSKPTFPASDIFDKLFGKNNYGVLNDYKKQDFDIKVNYKPTTVVSGCPFTARLIQVFKGSLDDSLNWKQLLTDRWIGSPLNEDDIITRYWQSLYFADLAGDRSSFTDVTRETALKNFTENFTSLSDTEAAKFVKIPAFRNDYASLSLKAIKLILPWLREGLLYSHAVFLAKLPEIIKPEIWSISEIQDDIIEAIISEIQGHDEVLLINHAVNSLIRDIRDEKMTKPNDNIWVKNTLHDKLSSHFGKAHWEKHHDKDNILSQAIRQFGNSISTNKEEPEFQKISRLEERIKEKLLQINYQSDSIIDNKDDVNKLYHPSAIERFIPEKILSKGKPVIKNGQVLYGLPNPLKSSLKNPVVMRALHQLRNLINHLLAEDLIDEKTAINIELARELNDANKRKAIEQFQRERETDRGEYRKEIIRLYKEQKGEIIAPTETDVQKYQLWLEQDRKCIYTGNQINLSDFIGPNPKYDIEHTLPRSRTLDNSLKNKTLADSKFNREIKGNKLPSELEAYENILQRIKPWVTLAEDLEFQVSMLKRRTKAASTKEQKDDLIIKRHLLTLKLEYWKEKTYKFTTTEIPEGFKISQKIDTGIITRYAKEFLGSLFKNRRGNPNVFAINGEMVAEFRKIWGLQSIFSDESGTWEMAPKNRSNHAHHAIDAVTIACIQRNSHSNLSHAWRLQEDGSLSSMRKTLLDTKPWDTFTEDMKSLHKDLIVIHKREDKPKKQTKKILRKRGIKQRKWNKPDEFIYQQGDTSRGSLHQETFYGRIQNPHLNKKDADHYVVRKSVNGISTADASNIVDPKIKEIVLSDMDKEKVIKSEIQRLEKTKKKADDREIKELDIEIEKMKNKMTKLFHIPPKEGKSAWTPIRKVRIKAKLTEPLPEFKRHRDLSRHDYKQQFYVNNDENYCMAIYKDDKGKHDFSLLNMMDAVQHFKMSNKDLRETQDLVLPQLAGRSLYGIIKRNTLVCFYVDSPDELRELSPKELTARMYKALSINKDSRIKFQHIHEARGKSQFKMDYISVYGDEPEKLMITGYSKFELKENPYPYLNIGKSNYQFIIQDYHFEITESGVVIFN
ncbi:MAG: hypothetical protein LAT67_10655 [Balneolales bacterium]|nr:hypothetical protein [Balneolales bacterium]